MHPCHQGANPLVQTLPAQGDGFLKIAVPWRALVCWSGGLGTAASPQC